MKRSIGRIFGCCSIALLCSLGALGSASAQDRADIRAHLAKKPDIEGLFAETFKTMRALHAKVGASKSHTAAFHEAAIYVMATQKALEASDPSSVMHLDMKAREVLNGVLKAQGERELVVSDAVKKYAKADRTAPFLKKARSATPSQDALTTPAGLRSWVESMKTAR